MPRGVPIANQIRQLIISEYKNGMSTYKIGDKFKISRSSIQTLINSYKENGSIITKKKTGRRSIATPADKRVLGRLIRNNRRATTAELYAMWRDSIKKDFSIDTCRRVIKKIGYGFYKAKEKPLLTFIQKKNWIRFAKEFRSWTIPEWRSIIWSDESTFQLCVGDERKMVIRTRNEAFHPDCLRRTVKFPKSVMVWGCMSGNGVGRLCFIEGTMNAAKYCNILKENLLPSIEKLQTAEGKFIFQQDGASCHTAKSTKQFLIANEIPTIWWPSSSPDLSPIESLWGKIKKQLKSRPARTVEELRTTIAAVWSSITIEDCQNLIDGLPARLKQVIARKGDVTKY